MIECCWLHLLHRSRRFWQRCGSFHECRCVVSATVAWIDTTSVGGSIAR